jgi:uncharacterized protein YdeI (YjbR/CyaY-like superfamily)
MKVTATFTARTRSEWRSWLAANHAKQTEIWLVTDKRPDHATVPYLDAVEEALCFGWIDSTAKRVSDYQTAQRFTPRRPRGSNWTELNKERCRRLIRLGLMTEAGRAKLPNDLAAPFVIADDIRAAIDANVEAKRYFDVWPNLYVRVRIGYIEEARKKPEEFTKRFNNFLRNTAAGKMLGNWNDGGRLLPPPP